MPAQQSVTHALGVMQLLAPRIRCRRHVQRIQIHLVRTTVPQYWGNLRRSLEVFLKPSLEDALTVQDNIASVYIAIMAAALPQGEIEKTGKYFQWTTDHDVIMCREVLVSKPYKFKPRTPERGQSWESVACQLNSIQQPSFRVTARSVRDRFTLLSTKYAQKLRMEEKASGIEVEQTELDSLLEEILEREKEAKKDLESEDREKKSKVEKEKATAEEVKKRALERMAKPKVEDQENKQKKPKVRRSTAEAIDYLRERSDNEADYRKQELEVRKREMEVQSKKQDQAHKQQQAMFTALMAQMQMQQQSQQSMQALLAAQQEQQTKLLKAFFENKK